MNELLLLGIAFVSTLFVVTMWRLGKERLYSAIIVLLILVSAVGGKIVAFFGHSTNTGNIFYASVYLATYFLIERFGKKEGIRSIWVGALCVLIFSSLVQFTVALNGSPSTQSVNLAYAVAFSPVIRIAFASVLAYVISQNFNVYFYIFIKEKLHSRKLWLRANISNTLSQIIDSIIFFLVTFLGVVPLNSLWEVIITGFVIKVVFMAAASPLLYLNKYEVEEGEEYSSITA